MLSKKPNTALGVKGSGHLTNSEKHCNNFVSPKNASMKSPTFVLRDNLMLSPLAIQNPMGFKTPTADMLGVELNMPVKQTMKNNYQSLLAPVVELHPKKAMNNSKGKLTKSRNDELKSNQSYKSSHTQNSLLHYQGQGSIGDLYTNVETSG